MISREQRTPLSEWWWTVDRLLLAAIIVLIMKALLGDIAMTKLRRDVRRLNQRIALMESEKSPRQER